ncbi:MAG: polyprenyl synthetase family protein [Opitutales bacterium]
MSTPLHAGLEAHFSALEAFLKEQESAFEPEVRPMVREALAHPGKRLRPLLAFGAGAGGPPTMALVRGAAIVELVHLATLVHDDVLDGADRRHGADTPNRTHGAHAAVLFGDALFAHALVLAAEHTTPELCRIVARASREVCSGEVCQTFSRGDDALSAEAYRRQIQLKTAELFEAACRLGSLLAGRPSEHVESCARFGRHLGIAYQIYDDLADLIQEESKAGKTLGTDVASGKLTLPMILERDLQGPEGVRRLRAGEDPRRAISSAAWRESFRQLDAEIAAAEAALAPAEGSPSPFFLLRLTGFLREAAARLAPL